MGLTGLTGHSLSPISPGNPVSPISPEISDCAFVSPVPPAPRGFFPCHQGKFKVGGLGGVVCHGAYLPNMTPSDSYAHNKHITYY